MGDKKDLKKAFEQAANDTAEDPNFVSTWDGLGMIFFFIGVFALYGVLYFGFPSLSPNRCRWLVLIIGLPGWIICKVLFTKIRKKYWQVKNRKNGSQSR